MPGSTAEDPPKAKVTASNGVFVRPVAVAGIFRPVQEKPLIIPEKRRFSALVGDFTPCSSGDRAEDFARRRQSWDTRQKEVPFGQALLKRTQKNISSSSLPTSQSIVRKNGTTEQNTGNGSCESENSTSVIKESGLIKKGESLKPHNENRIAFSVTNKDYIVPVPIEKNQTACNVEPLFNHTDFSELNAKTEKTVVSNSDGEVSRLTIVPSQKSSANENVLTSNFAENPKQAKKIYGLIKRDFKSEIFNVSAENSSVKTNPSVDDTASSDLSSTGATKTKPKIYGLNRNSKKEHVDIKTAQEISGRNVSPLEKSVCESAKYLENASFTNESSFTELDKSNKSKEREFSSPPKDFRPMRRTSDVIAAKIQNIFSNISPQEKSLTFQKKPLGKVFGSIVKNQVSSVEVKAEEISDSKSSNDQKIQNLNTSVDLKIKVEKEIDLCTRHTEPGTKLQCKVKQRENSTEIKVQPLLGDSKTKLSNQTIPSKGQKILNIEGKMPIKKTDQISADGTVLQKATNQGTDRKSVDFASFSTTIEDCNKGAVSKKDTAVINNRSFTVAAEKGVKVVSSINSSCVSKTQQYTLSETLRNGSHETLCKKEASVTEKTVAKNSSQQVIKTASENISVISKNSKNEKIFYNVENVTNGVVKPGQISKVEVTKITPSTVPGIVPTVNVLFRTKSPQSSAIKEENRKKVVVETFTNNSPISATLIESSNASTNLRDPFFNASQSVKEAFEAVEIVKNSLTHSPTISTKHGIVNLKNEELTSIALTSISDNCDTKYVCKGFRNTCENNNLKAECSSNATKDKSEESNISPAEVSNKKTEKVFKNSPSDYKTFPCNRDQAVMNHATATVINEPFENVNVSGSATCLYDIDKSTIDCSKSSSDSKMSVVDLGDWNKKFQKTDSETPRAPLRRRSQRDSLPPALPLRTTSRFGSLKRIEDPPRYVPRSPSHNSLPQRYSYTEMLSKVCSMGVLPFVDPHYSKSCSSSSSQVSELWSELGEEQSTAHHASEMLEAETSERMRLEKEVQELQNRYSQVQQKSDKMEMEMIEARVYRTPELNGDISEDDDAEGNSSLYKQKYERAIRDMEIMKRRMQQQHEEEMEQKSMLKKASDKRLAEALEDVEEERQVASQWKRKAQKLGAELQDLRLMLEEQMARNGELEKKQRKFDAELSAAQEEIKKERLLREKISREKDQAIHEKYSLEQDLQASKIDSDMLHEKITQLNRELDELTLSSKGEEEVTQLKRAKQELERKSRDQEEELEELAAQVQMLEQAKLRLEMSLEKVRQEHRREASVREEEIEEIRASFSKKIKNLEAQLETEQDERHQLMKQKHELERCIYELSDQPPPQDPEIERRLRRDLKRTKALLRDAQSMLEHTREGQSGKTLIRQLKNQLEDSEFAKAAAVKARQAVEAELQECQSQLEEVTRVKNEAESRCLQLSREKSAIQTQLEEAEEEMSEVMKKYKAVVAQMSIDQKSLAEQNLQIAELETERQMLKDQLSEVSHKFEHLATQSEDTHKVHRLDGKVRDLESKLELEQTTRTRLEHQIARLKEQSDRMREECDSLRNKELQAQEGVRRLQRQIRDLRDDYSNLQQKEAEAYRKQHELEMALENTETDLQVTKNDLRLALQRIQDLQNALEDDLDSGTDVPDDSGSDSDSSFELSVLRNSSVTPVQRCESVSSNLSYGVEGIQSRTSSFSRELSTFGRMMLKRTSMDFLG